MTPKEIAIATWRVTRREKKIQRPFDVTACGITTQKQKACAKIIPKVPMQNPYRTQRWQPWELVAWGRACRHATLPIRYRNVNTAKSVNGWASLLSRKETHSRRKTPNPQIRTSLENYYVVTWQFTQKYMMKHENLPLNSSPLSKRDTSLDTLYLTLKVGVARNVKAMAWQLPKRNPR